MEKIHIIPKYSEDKSKTVGKENIKKVKQRGGKLEFTGAYIHLAPICNFNCKGCFVNKIQTSLKGVEPKIERSIMRLSFEDITRIVDFAKDRGAESIIFAGAGEPLLDPEYDRIRGYIHEKDLQIVLFTNATQIKNIKRAKELLLDGPVIAKLYSLEEEIYDELVGVKRAFKETMAGIEKLIEAKKQLEEEGFEVTLGVDSYISKANKEGLKDVLRFSRENQIIPYFEAFIEIGQPRELIDQLSLTEKELVETFVELAKIDEEEFGIKTPIYPGSRNYGQEPCFKSTHMFNVRDNGDVFTCVCTLRKVGNIYEYKDPYKALDRIFDVNNPKLLSHMRCDLCSKRINPRLLREIKRKDLKVVNIDN